MSWLSKAIHGDTSSIAKVAGIVAAPFTAGASLAVTGAAMMGDQQAANRDAAAQQTRQQIDAAKTMQDKQLAAQAINGQRAGVSDLAQFRDWPGSGTFANESRANSGGFSWSTLLILAAVAAIVILFLKGR